MRFNTKDLAILIGVFYTGGKSIQDDLQTIAFLGGLCMTNDWGPVFSPVDVGLVLSYQCQLSCKHCVYNCGPHWQEWMTADTIRKALINVKSLGGDIQVHITGGEPFLNFPLLVQAVSIASNLNLPRYVETDAAWCLNRQIAREHFCQLKEAGLQAILISCSPFHAEYIPLLQTVIAIETAVDVFLAQNVYIAEIEWLEQISRFGIIEPIPLQRYSQAYGHDPAGLLFWESYHLKSGGRAGYALGDYTERNAPSSYEGENCELELLYPQHAHLDPYGNFSPDYCGGLCMGDWNNLQELQRQYQAGIYPPLITLLVAGGPYSLYQYAHQEYGFQANMEGYAGKCHLCVDVRRHLVKFNQFSELQPLTYYEEFSHPDRSQPSYDRPLNGLQEGETH